MKALGIHLLIELCSCNRQKLDDMDYLEMIMAQAAEVAGATVLKTAFQNFNLKEFPGLSLLQNHI